MSKRQSKRNVRSATNANPLPSTRRAPQPIAPLAARPDDSRPWHRWLGAALVALAALLVYWNTLGNDFVTWDDREYVYENPLLEQGLVAIWTDVVHGVSKMQWYPLVYTSYWIEKQIAGLDPTIYHATQMGLHAINAALLLFALRWLGVGLFPATFTALLFAVHPINVASVSWIAERKNTLSGGFFLASLLCYLYHRRRGNRLSYGASILLYVGGLLSKTATLTLAPILLITDRLLDRRWTSTSLLRTLPFFLLGLAMAVVTMYVEHKHGRSGEPLPMEVRPLVALAAIAHYLHKLFVPINLLPIYPRWADNLPDALRSHRYLVSIAVLVATAILLWRCRRHLPRFAFWGLAIFLLTTAPMLGFKHFNFLQYSFVSDHYLYLGGPGIMLIVALLIERWRNTARLRQNTNESDNRSPLPPRTARTAVIYALTALLALTSGWLTVRQNRVWASGETFGLSTLAGNPDCFPGHYNLANAYYRAKDYERALNHYAEAARIQSTHVLSRRSCARCARNLGREDDAIAHYRDAIKTAERTQRAALNVHLEFAAYLRRLGRNPDALVEYQAILRKAPDHEAAKAGIRSLRRQRGLTPPSP